MIVFKDQIWIKNASGFWKKIKFLRFAQNRRSEILLPAGPLEGMVLFRTLYKVLSAEISHNKKSLIGKDSYAYCVRFFAGRGFYVIIADCCNQKAGTPNRPKFQFLLNQLVRLVCFQAFLTPL
jgi:hypothetical protein